MTVVAGRFDSTTFAKAGLLGDKTQAQPISPWASEVEPAVKSILIQSVVINSSAFESDENGKTAFVGSKIEAALLQFARDHLGLQSLEEVKANAEVIQIIPFSTDTRCMGTVIKLKSGGFRLFVTGDPDMLLGRCKVKINAQFQEVPLSESDRQTFMETIDQYGSQSLVVIGLTYRDFEQWPPAGMLSDSDSDGERKTLLLGDLCLLGVFGIQNRVHTGVPEAVLKMRSAGIVVQMVTGDNTATARAVASACGILTDGLVMEGRDFRALSQEEMDAVMPKLQVLSRCSPNDKRLLVSRLKAHGEIIAMTGNSIGDTSAWKLADVRISMHTSGSEMAKQESGIIFMNGSFASVLEALAWGQAVHGAVQRFLQVI